MTPIPRGDNFWVKYVKLVYVFKNSFFSTARQTEYKESMKKEGSTKIVNFFIPGAGVLVLGRGHISHKHVHGENTLFL